MLHDAFRDTRTPTHELTIARDVLRTRWRIAAQPPGWALSPDGLRSLRGQAWPAPSVGEDGGVQRESVSVHADVAHVYAAGEGEGSITTPASSTPSWPPSMRFWHARKRY